MAHKILRIHAGHVDALRGENLGNCELYAQFGFAEGGKRIFKRTTFKKGNGKTAVWNEIVTYDFEPSWRDELYIEVFEHENSVHKLVGFSTVLMDKMVKSNATSKLKFDLLDVNRELKGTITVTISVVDTNKSGSPVSTDGPEKKGENIADDHFHMDRIKSEINPIDNIHLLPGKSYESLYVRIKHANSIDDGGRVLQANVKINLSTEHKAVTNYSEYRDNKVEWNHTIVLKDFHPLVHRFLYVKVFGYDPDKDKGSNAFMHFMGMQTGDDKEAKKNTIVRYAAIPLQQVDRSYDRSMNGVFPLYDEDWNVKGTINLVLSMLNHDPYDEYEKPQCETISNREHRERVTQEIGLQISSDPTPQFLQIHARYATALENNDRALITCALFKLDIYDTGFDAYQRTDYAEYDGNKVEWDEVVRVWNFSYDKYPNLYVEVNAEDIHHKTVLRHASIPLKQVFNPGFTTRGNFDLYDENGRIAGTIGLTIILVEPQVSDMRSEVKGSSTVEGHQDFIKFLDPWRDPRTEPPKSYHASLVALV